MSVTYILSNWVKPSIKVSALVRHYILDCEGQRIEARPVYFPIVEVWKYIYIVSQWGLVLHGAIIFTKVYLIWSLCAFKYSKDIFKIHVQELIWYIMIGHYCLDDVIGIHGDVLNSGSTIVIHIFLESKE